MRRTVSAARLVTMLGSSLDRSPAYRGLADGLRLLITDGRLPPGTYLPSERELTAALALSRTTVSRAYDQLRAGGFLVSRQGSGSLVTLPGAASARRDPLLVPQEGDGLLDLTAAAPAAPPGVTAAYAAALEKLPAYLGGTGYFPSGLPDLKEAIARRYGERGLPTDPAQVVVTTGALAASAVVARAVLRPGARVLAESPSYPNVLTGFARSGARVAGLPLDHDGWDTGEVGAALRGRPALTYLIPDFQNPTGLMMDDAQRAEIGAALDRSGTVTLVDETLAELSLDQAAPPLPMAAHVRDCVSIGSASKTFWGGLRIGWIRAPHPRVAAMIAARLGHDLGAPLVEQLAVVELLDHQEAVVAFQRARLTASRDALARALALRLPDWRFRLPTGGLALWCELPEPRATALATAAADHGLRIAPGPSFAPEGGLERFVRLPYTAPPEVLTEAVDLVAAAWESTRAAPAAGRPPAALVM